MKRKTGGWIVIVGKPVFVCRTRRQARRYVKEHKIKRGNGYNYVGQCTNKYRKIVLDV